MSESTINPIAGTTDGTDAIRCECGSCAGDQQPVFQHEEAGGWVYYCSKADFSAPVIVMYPATATKLEAVARLRRLLADLRRRGFSVPGQIEALYNQRGAA